MIDAKEAHVLAREWGILLISNGARVDKKLMKYNDIVEEALNHQEFSPDHDFFSGLSQALTSRIVGHRDYSKNGSRYPEFAWTGQFDSRGLMKAFENVGGRCGAVLAPQQVQGTPR